MEYNINNLKEVSDKLETIKDELQDIKEEIVEECKLYYRDSGGKLSPLLNKLLEDWLKLQKKSKNNKPYTLNKKEDKKDLPYSDIDLLGDDLK